MQIASDILKDVIFFVAIGGGGYLLWILIGKIATKYSWPLDVFGRTCYTLFATGSIAWILFMIYFAITA